MLEKNLEECLNNAFKFAHENNHEFVTTEHLLLCILNNQEALNVLFRASLMVLVYCSPHFQCQNEEKIRSGSDDLFSCPGQLNR